MSDERIDDLVNRPKVKSDIDFVNELLAKVMKNISDINNIKINVDTGKGMADAARNAEAAAKATDSLATATAKLQTANTALVAGTEAADLKWREMAGTLRDNIKLQIQYESELNKVKDAIKEQNAQVANTGTSFNTVSQKIIELKQRETELKTAIAEVNQTIKAQVKETQAAEGSYDAMNQELGQMRNLFRQLSADDRNNPAIGGALKKNISGLDVELKKIDAELGNFQRNVGNYKSGFNGLGNSINQITRELPAFTFSAQTGFLALSNNIPILADNIQQTAKQIKAMRAEGQQVPGLFKQIAAGIFSFGTALSIGVTLLTVYGKEVGNFFAELFKGKPKLDAAKMAHEGLIKVMSEGNGEYQKATQSINELGINVDLAKKGFLDKTDVIKQYNDGIGKTIGQVKTLEEVEDNLTKKGPAYIQMMLLKSAANLALEDASKKAYEAELARGKNADEFLTTGDKVSGFVSGLSSAPGYVPQDLSNQKIDQYNKRQANVRKTAAIKVAEDEKKTYLNIAQKFQADAAEIAKNFNFDFFGDEKKDKKGAKDKTDKIFKEGDDIRKANYEVQKRILEDTRDNNDRIVKDDEAAFLLRTEAAKKYLASTLALRKLEYDYQNNDIDLKESEEIKIANREYKNVVEREKAVKYITDRAAAQRSEAQVKYNFDLIKIQETYQHDYLGKLKEFLTKEEKEAQKHQDRMEKVAEEQINTDKTNAIAKLDQQFSDGLITQEKYNKKKLKIEHEYQVKLLEQQIDYAQKQIEIARQVAIATGDEEAITRLNEARSQLFKLRAMLAGELAKYTKDVDDQIDEETLKRIAALKKYSDYALDILKTASDLIAAGYERQKNAIEDQINAIEKRKNAEIDAVNATTASEEEKAAKISIINVRAQAQKEALELRQRQLDQKKARFEKALNIASIIQETALAVIKALSSKPPNIPLAIAVGALGAAKLAVAIATPIPTYAEGTQNHPGGEFVAGEVGKKELVIEPSGKAWVTRDTATLYTAPKGTKVFADAKEALKSAQQIAFKNLPGVVTEKNYSQEMVSAIVSEMGKLNTTVKNKKETHIRATYAGMHKHHKDQFNFVEYLNNSL